MAKKFPLEIVISATDKASAALRAVSDRVDKFQQPFARLSKSFSMLSDKLGVTGVANALKNVGVAALDTAKKITVGFIAATAALGAFLFRQVNVADSINDTATRLNISTKAFQAWQYGFRQADILPEQFAASLDTLNKNLGMARIGLGKGLVLFRGLGIDPKRFKSIDELLPVLADKLARVKNPSTRAAIALKLLGDAGPQMAIKLAEGSGALREMMAQAEKAGIIIDGSVLSSADELNNKLEKLKGTFDAVSNNALGRLYPALQKLADAISDALVKYQPQIDAFVQQFSDNLPTYVEKTLKVFQSLGIVLNSIADSIKWCNDKFGTTNTILALLAVTIGRGLLTSVAQLTAALIRMGISLAVAFPIPTLIVAAVAAAVAAGWWLYKNWNKISDAIGGTIAIIVENFSNAWGSVKSAAVSAFEWILEKLNWLWERSPLYFAFKGIQFVASKISGAGAAAPLANGTSIFSQSAMSKQQVDVKVDLSNLPQGTRTFATASDGINFDLSRGFALPGAF